MSAPIPHGRLQWAVSLSLFVVLVAVTTIGALKQKGRVENMKSGVIRGEASSVPEEWHPICVAMCDDHENAKRQYEEMKVRQKKRCDEKIARWEKEREALMERVDADPCCEGGCTEELVYKDYLLQSQATYYRMILKKHCGVKRPPDPDEKELKSFMKEIEEEEEEVF